MTQPERELLLLVARAVAEYLQPHGTQSLQSQTRVLLLRHIAAVERQEKEAEG